MEVFLMTVIFLVLVSFFFSISVFAKNMHPRSYQQNSDSEAYEAFVYNQIPLFTTNFHKLLTTNTVAMVTTYFEWLNEKKHAYL